MAGAEAVQSEKQRPALQSAHFLLCSNCLWVATIRSERRQQITTCPCCGEVLACLPVEREITRHATDGLSRRLVSAPAS
ncbi:MAG: hypothetical protein ABI361_08800 [Nitrososphaera sp.]